MSLFGWLRNARRVRVLPDAASFWAHCDRTRRIRHTPPGPQADAEERLDLRAAEAIKALLEAEVGPEEGPEPVQMQNWDWHDDRCRGVAILRRAFRPELLPKLQALLTGELSEFGIILSLQDDWTSEAWGHIRLDAGQIAVQRNVAQAYAIAA